MAAWGQPSVWGSQMCVRWQQKKGKGFPIEASRSTSIITSSSTTSVASSTMLSSGVSSKGFLMGPFQEGKLSQPSWTGDEPLSRLVSALISIKPLFALMSLGARQVLIGSAEKNGVPWRKLSEECLASDVYAEKDLLEDKSVIYPDYYVKNFHCYPDGNLSWKAASEVEAATSSMIIRAIPKAKNLEEAIKVLRGNWLRAIEDYHLVHSGNPEIRDILDVGCSVGISTRCLADTFPSAQVTGLDLSPYFVAVAQHKDKKEAAAGKRREKPIHWVHALGENTGLRAQSFDIVSLAYVIHECPQDATKGLLKEAFRLLRPGGTVALTDNSPKSKIIQNLPPPLFTLMKASEPWMDEYYSMDLEGLMYEVGFTNVKSQLTDPRHRTATGSLSNLQFRGEPSLLIIMYRGTSLLIVDMKWSNASEGLAPQ
ncbi:hypothetical protein GOP47_0019911 [Adiantum capillus-veneris]|uniref:Methyltransferase type 11 domain-containing protein n=1 Tax=Adiantum capillus-veneris TaxID=13818 RepID=A0A9D4ZA35_ADICA|nr:hypothetical protein GOP47_0019911 [Adiantum capillus-veneris]